MRVDGSEWPDLAWSWLPSSTDPSESRPHSMSGASGSTLPPVVWLRDSMMKSMLTAVFSPASATGPPDVLRYFANAVSSGGTSGMPPRNLAHLSTYMATTDGPRDVSD